MNAPRLRALSDDAVPAAPSDRRDERDLLERLLQKALPVGGVYAYDYASAVVLTDDALKAKGGGIAKTQFLFAAAVDGSGARLRLPEPEVLLLRVRGIAPLPNEGELIAQRASMVRKQFVSLEDPGTQGALASADGPSLDHRAFLQTSALDCEILGTFYLDEKTGLVDFGADVDNVYSSARMAVFAPSPGGLTWIASYPRQSADGSDFKIPIGNVRYAATRRGALASGIDGARVNVHVADFVARKAAILGMTRSGKSNTIKTVVTAVYRYAAETGTPVGQLLFDPQGEYANVNQQDGTGLRLLGGEEQVRVYKVNPDPDQPQEKPMRVDFFDVDMVSFVQTLISDALDEKTKQIAYIERFLNTSLVLPDRGDFPPGGDGDKAFQSEVRAVERGRFAFYGLLAKVGFAGNHFTGTVNQPNPDEQYTSPVLPFMLKDSAATELLNIHPGSLKKLSGGKYAAASPRGARDAALWIARETAKGKECREDLLSFTECDPFMAVARPLTQSGMLTGRLSSLREFHQHGASGEVSELVWEDMKAGRLSIVDLSVGNPAVTAMIAERIVGHLLDEASALFRSGADPVPVQVIVEEAHNLFERSGGDAINNPWVRLSKEAAKYKMGLLYATQEVTSVDKRILSNTSNWLIAHLNSTQETQELARYYDFETFGESLRRVDEKGFVRLKTYSGRYIVPVQIDKFDHAMINAARVAAGLAEVSADGAVPAVAGVAGGPKPRAKKAAAKKAAVSATEVGA